MNADFPSHAPAGYQCPFCAIVRGKERPDVATKQDDVVLRAELVTAFVSSHQWPNNPGHVLIIPNDHFENLYALPSNLAIPIQVTSQTIAKALKTAFKCPGTSTRQHNEPAGGQDVWHCHVHVFPRFDSDNLYGSHRQHVPEGDRAAQARLIRKALESQERSNP